jgi:hypothetical protein
MLLEIAPCKEFAQPSRTWQAVELTWGYDWFILDSALTLLWVRHQTTALDRYVILN